MSNIKRIKPSLSKGTRDFLPKEVAKRNHIFNVIKGVLAKYGFEQIETPAIENLETLEGKYGEEGDKLLFKIRSNKNLRYKLGAEKAVLLDQVYPYFIPEKSEKGLRYDLTVPLARYVVMHQDDIAFPFRRFHIGPVWRGDNPQKGRYQEFYQCDADIIGSTSIYNEIELTNIYLEVFAKLGFLSLTNINHRELLGHIGFWLGIQNAGGFTTTIDKLDKIGIEGVALELNQKGLHFDAIKLHSLVSACNGIVENLQLLNWLTTNLELDYFSTHFQAIVKILELCPNRMSNSVLRFDPLLARGLDYYTGVIWEVKPAMVQMGSLGGGGRYDNLTEMFGGQNMSGVGISFGIERIYDVMEELNLFPTTIAKGVEVLFVPRDESVEEFTFKQVQYLRGLGIPAEIFLGNVKKQKHFNYVEAKNITYLVEVGSNEKDSATYRLRNAKTRDTQEGLTIEQIAELLSAH